MEIANLTTTLNTIQIISITTYLHRLSSFMHLSYNLNVNLKNNNFAIINSLVNYIKIYGDHDDNTNFLTHYLLNDNVYYDETIEKKIKYNVIFKKVLFDYIIHKVIFNDFGNVYGFLAEHVRKLENYQSIDNLLKYVKLTLTYMRCETNNQKIALHELTIRRIFYETIVPLFPKVRKNLSLNSIDLIYAQAGCRYAYSSCHHYYYTYTLGNELNDDDENGLFDKHIEIVMAIKQLIGNGIINKLWIKIFALPAILNYVHDNRETLEDIEMKVIISNRHYWMKAYRYLFSYLQNADELIRKTKAVDPKYQYYLAVLNFKNYTTLAKEELKTKCLITNETQLQNEIDKYINNTSNYTCLGIKNLPPLTEIYDEQFNDIMDKYYQFRKEINKETNVIKNRRFEINGEIFVDCKQLSEKTVNNLHCLSLLYSCIVGFIEGNPINSINNCPIRGAIRIKHNTKFDDISQEITTIQTRNVLSKYGTTIKTLAVMSSCQMIVNDKQIFSQLNKIDLKNITFFELGIPQLLGIDHGLEINSMKSSNDLIKIGILLTNIKNKFFYFI
ncbi:uncharacterized protein LOC127290931 [Leptopilina boulardi]|uniref:uncharacterized protein LOC127290931 n=1 Tax=Leptopilina boulardi TaxID=63433 RepID=UPI0021F66A51|nr:uncharacterized protein LOC127290931 [Leptopilina boulardi]